MSNLTNKELNKMKDEKQPNAASPIEPVDMSQALQTLREMTQVQCRDGNWNYDPYMQGMANGLIFALSIFDGSEPIYLLKAAPRIWLKDKTENTMSKLEDFTKCVIETKVDGKTCLDCKLGLWGVNSSDTDIVYLEAFYYWNQYNEDGEYYEILGGESPAEKLN